MCDKHSIRELREYAELKNLWHKTCEIIDDNKHLVCPHCGKSMVKHIIQEGARFHVTSYHSSPNGAYDHCSEKDCECNHGEGHCVPYARRGKEMEFLEAYVK